MSSTATVGNAGATWAMKRANQLILLNHKTSYFTVGHFMHRIMRSLPFL
jgi:hypothetical protein